MKSKILKTDSKEFVWWVPCKCWYIMLLSMYHERQWFHDVIFGFPSGWRPEDSWPLLFKGLDEGNSYTSHLLCDACVLETLNLCTHFTYLLFFPAQSDEEKLGLVQKHVQTLKRQNILEQCWRWSSWTDCLTDSLKLAWEIRARRNSGAKSFGNMVHSKGKLPEETSNSVYLLEFPILFQKYNYLSLKHLVKIITVEL